MLDNEFQNTQVCPSVGTQFATVSIPVTVKPFAVSGPASVECCGEPVISGEEPCRGKVGAACHFVISQKIKIGIPVDFGAAARVGEAFVDCEHIHIDNGSGDNNPCYPCGGKY
ncbi:MAG: hypothetical protein LBT12_04260 [Oscillospiraceae bacterium]|jgi:hypothetical protein|nr:hypothetical protein [Oscillospiraceae bacterium]